MNRNLYWAIFLIGFMVKLAMMPWIGSHFSQDLFIPFLDSSILNPQVNPWSLDTPEHFPYGTILYVSLIGPKLLGYWILGPAALGSGWLGMLLFKMPILMFDAVLFLALARRFSGEKYRLLGFYWFNPIVFYVNYCLGHIDIIPMAFITLSCLALFQDLILFSGVLAACAIASKFHTAVALPLLLLYIWRNEYWPKFLGKISVWSGAFILTAAAALWLPYKAGHLGYVTMTSPEAMRIFSFALQLGEGTNLYLGFAFVLVVIGRLLVTKKVTEHGLFFGVGIIFASLLLVTNPYASWYLWLFPFCAVFAAEYRLIHWALPMTLMSLYFVHFVILPLLVTPDSHLLSMSLTLLQVMVGAYLALMWYFVGKREFPLSGRLRPFVIGIAGDSGAGKNRLSDCLSSVFEVRQHSFVEGDDYHRWERGHQSWTEHTHLSPRANFLDTMSSHTLTLSSGRTVQQPHYDHSSGRFTAARAYMPSQTIIVQGLHALYSRSMRDVMDLKVFVNPDPLIRLSWKIARDVGERGHVLEKVLDSVSRRRSDGQKFIEPQRFYADWIIEAIADEELEEKEIVAGYQPKLKMRHILWNDSPVNSLVESLSKIATLNVQLKLIDNDIERIAVVVSGNILAEQIEQIAHQMFPLLRSLTRSRQKPRWADNFDGINQLIALSLLHWKDILGVRR